MRAFKADYGLGYDYLVLAADISADGESLAWRLHMEYANLLDWAESAGLKGDDPEKAFRQRIKVDPVIVNAVLSQIYRATVFDPDHGEV